eukprot:1071802-Prymnesium_polylepis.1
MQPSIRVPEDNFTDEQLLAQRWPTQVAAWWNAGMQPIGRRAFRRRHGHVETVRDEPLLVLAHKLMPLP